MGGPTGTAYVTSLAGSVVAKARRRGTPAVTEPAVTWIVGFSKGGLSGRTALLIAPPSLPSTSSHPHPYTSPSSHPRTHELTAFLLPKLYPFFYSHSLTAKRVYNDESHGSFVLFITLPLDPFIKSISL